MTKNINGTSIYKLTKIHTNILKKQIYLYASSFFYIKNKKYEKKIEKNRGGSFSQNGSG
jgi:hypothetical protein